MRIEFNKKYLIILFLTLLSLTAGLYTARKLWAGPKIIKEAPVNISAEQRAEYEKIINEANEKLAKLPQEVPDSERINPLMDKAQALYGLGKYEEAQETLKLALEVDGGRHDALLLLSEVERDMGDLESAQKNIDTALFLSPIKPEYWLSKIELVEDYLGGSREQLEEIYKTAAFETNFHQEIVVSYARYMESLGDLGPALSFWRIALQNDPENQTYKEQIKRLEEKINELYGP